MSDSDLVVTSDVDIFVMDPRLLEDLGRTDLYDTWVYQYQTTARTGGTFGMSFLVRNCGRENEKFEAVLGPTFFFECGRP